MTMAESTTESLSKIVSELAHEINNPLMIVQGKSQLLQDRIKNKMIDTEGILKDLQIIETNCIRMDKIIKALKKHMKT